MKIHYDKEKRLFIATEKGKVVEELETFHDAYKKYCRKCIKWELQDFDFKGIDLKKLWPKKSGYFFRSSGKPVSFAREVLRRRSEVYRNRQHE